MDAEENQKQVFPRRPQPLEIAARCPHSHRRDEAVEVENQKQVFPLSTATGWLFRPNSERRPGGGASLLLQAHCSIRKCSHGAFTELRARAFHKCGGPGQTARKRGASRLQSATRAIRRPSCGVCRSSG